VAAGLVIVAVTRITAFAIIAVAVLLLLVPTLRRALRLLGETRPQVTVGEAVGAARADPALTLPRLLYWAGAATVTILAIRPTPIMTISDWFFLASLLLTTAVLLFTGRLTFAGLPSGLLLGILIYSIGAFVSSLHTPHMLASISILLRFVYLTVGWFWLGTVVLETPRHVRIAVACWALSAAIAGAASVVQLLAGDVIPSTSPIRGRMTGLAVQFNDLGGAAAVALIPAIVVASMMTCKARRALFALCVVPLTAAGLLLSGSVSAIAGAGVGVLFWIAMGRVSAKSLLVACAAGLSVVVILDAQRNAGAPSPIDRFRGSTDTTSQYCTLCSRLATNRAAWEAIGQHPIIGAGLDPISGITATGSEVHNMILGPWFEAGIFGAIGMVTIVTVVAVTAVGAVRHARSSDEWSMCLALLASFLSFILIGMGQPILFQRYGWICAALIFACRFQQKSVSSANQRRITGGETEESLAPISADRGGRTTLVRQTGAPGHFLPAD
jgi:O-antigen ligase